MRGIVAVTLVTGLLAMPSGRRAILATRCRYARPTGTPGGIGSAPRRFPMPWPASRR